MPGAKGANLRSSRDDLVRDAHQAHQIHRALDAVEILRPQFELLQQELRHRGRAVVGDLQAHCVAEVALRQLALQADAQVLHFFLVHEQVAVARHAELVTAAHLHAGKQLADMRMQDGREEHEAVRATRYLRRHQDGSRQHARRLHDGLGGVAPESVLALQFDRKVQALVEHARERMRRVETDGRQYRHHLAQEKILDPGLLRFIPVRAAQELDALLRQGGNEFFVEQLVLPGDELVRRRVQTLEDLRGLQAVRPGREATQLGLLFQPRNADLEELIQVAADDAQVSQPLQQRNRRVFRLRQDATVEFEQAELAVQEILRRERFCHGRGCQRTAYWR